DLETAATSVKVFAVTTSPPQLVAMTASLDSAGSVQLPIIDGTCALTGVLPRRIAVAPGKSDLVYIADGAGNGVVTVDPATCAMGRIGKYTRPTRSVAVSPPWYEENGVTHPAGEIVMMILDPLA